MIWYLLLFIFLRTVVITQCKCSKLWHNVILNLFTDVSFLVCKDLTVDICKSSIIFMMYHQATNPFHPEYKDPKNSQALNPDLNREKRFNAWILQMHAHPSLSSWNVSVSNKPVAKVLPLRREANSSASKRYSSSAQPLQQQQVRNHQPVGCTGTSSGAPPVISPFHHKQNSKMKDLLQWYTNTFQITDSSTFLKRDLDTMPSNFNQVGRQYSTACGYDTNKDLTLKRTYHVLEEAHCYYGALSMQSARQKLKFSPEGTYLIRDSSDSRFLFSISIKTKRGVTAIRVLHSDGQFSLDCEENVSQHLPTFSCILQLLQFYTNLRSQSSSSKNNTCVFLETRTGRRDIAVFLSRPSIHTVPSLKSLARKSLNCMLSEEQRKKLLIFMSPCIEQFMTDYPYQI